MWRRFCYLSPSSHRAATVGLVSLANRMGHSDRLPHGGRRGALRLTVAAVACAVLTSCTGSAGQVSVTTSGSGSSVVSESGLPPAGTGAPATAAHTIGEFACTAVPAPAASNATPGTGKGTDAGKGSAQEKGEVGFGGTAEWASGLSLTVGEGKTFQPTEAEIAAQVGAKHTGLGYLSFPVTLVNHTGTTISTAILGGDQPGDFGGLIAGGRGAIVTGSTPERAALIRDGEAVTLDRKVWLADPKQPQLTFIPYRGASAVTFTAGRPKSAITLKAPAAPLISTAAFQSPVSIGDLRITATTPTPYTPSAAATPLTAPRMLTTELTIANAGNNAVDLGQLTITPVAGGQACSLTRDPAIGAGQTSGLHLAAGSTRTVRIAFGAAASGDIRLQLGGAVTNRSGSVGYAGIAAAVALISGPAAQQPATISPADRPGPLADDVPATVGQADYGKPVSWTDGTALTATAPSSADTDCGACTVELPVTVTGPGVKAITGSWQFALYAGGKFLAVAESFDGDAPKKVAHFSYTGQSVATAKLTVVAYFAGYAPIALGPGAAAQVLDAAPNIPTPPVQPFGATYTYPDGVSVTATTPETYTDPRRPGLMFGKVTVTNGTDKVYPEQLSTESVRSGRTSTAVPGGSAPGALFGTMSVLLPGTTAQGSGQVYLSQGTPDRVVISLDPYRPPVVFATSVG